MKKVQKNSSKRGMVMKVAMAIGFGVAVTAVKRSINPPKKLELKNKVILITGGSRGLGLILARKLSESGTMVAICGRSEETLQKASKDLASTGNKIFAIPCDITDKQQVQQMVRKITDEVGSIDVLINNAGSIMVGPAESMNQEDYEQAMNTHFWGPFYVINEVLPDMKERKQGHIVNVASIGSKVSFPHLLPYNTSKYALSGFSEGLASELNKYNIKVTTVYPGLMRTGSPRNIDVKGQYAKEYAWFKISDSLPGISMNADRAAAKIIEALRDGKRTLTLTWLAKIAVATHGIAPDFISRVFNFADYLLPAGRESESSQKGYESESKISESFLTKKTDEAAESNLEV